MQMPPNCRAMASTRHINILLAAVCLLTALISVCATDDGPLISLQQGRYRGNYVMSPTGQTVEEYLGIPFAKPPVGNLRFADPEAVEPKPDEIFNAQRFGASCPQVPDTVFGNFTGSTMWNPPGEISEDCLYLNVWVPQGNSQQDKTVMVWIFGGGFYSGTTAVPTYNGKTLAAFSDVVIVSISHRLGVFGFLSTGDGRIRGNFGFMDQVLALTWVRDNIRAFGGHPDRVTLFGESSGAVSVVYHMLSPLSNGLFKRGIIQSHADDHLVFVDDDKAKKSSQRLFNKIGCRDDSALMKCLRGHHFGRFVKEQWLVSDNLENPFLPTKSPFMPNRPEVMLQDLDFNKKDILLGANKNEATWFMLYRLKSVSKDDQVSGQTRQNVRDALKLFSTGLSDEQKEDIIEFYTKDIDENDLVGNRDAIDAMYGDRFFACPSRHVADSNTEAGGNTYFYYYNHRASNEVWPKWCGVMHAAELMFMFGVPLNSSKGFTREERRFSERMMTYWTNFAKSGNPNSHGNSPWPKYTSDRKEFLELALREKKHEGGYKQSECAFWRGLLSSGTMNYGQMASVSIFTLVSLVFMKHI